MRYQSIRSVFRASLVAGLIASCQNAAFSASWKDSQHPFGGTCFIHDLQWEQLNSQISREEYSSKSLLTSDSEIVQTSDRETVICVAAAEQFELSMQVEQVFAALRSQSNPFFGAGAKIFQSYSRSRRMLISAIDSQSLKLVEWIKVANSFPPMVVDPQGNHDFECGLDCGGWSHHVPHSVSHILPYRGCANVFVYSLDVSTESPDSDNIPVAIVASSEHDETPIGPDQFNAENGLVSDAELTASVSTIIATASDFSPLNSDTDHAKQVGVDPIRPPTLEAEYETQLVVTPFEIEEQSVFEYGNHWVNSLSSANWFNGIGKRFAFGDSDPRMPIAGPPIATFSKEDLAVASSLAVDYAMNVISPTTTEAKSQMSKGVASQIRTVGQFLVDFANQIENRIEQVEIARRDNIQR